ncbi:hypothetical protein SK128_003646 [Halocaridina rubra]|uniref:[2Fe-2S]-binding domain-containing protein n=1 Tax=Halocaridina rubra TaxID=373956 RepID=A0AAN8WK98_HALRR
MSMYTLLRNDPLPSLAQINEYFVGNLCRCTGYRPILDGFRGLSAEAKTAKGCGKRDCCQLKCSVPETNGTLNGTSNGSDCKNDTANKDSTVYEDSNISEILFDEDEFKTYDPSQEVIFPPELKVNTNWLTESLEFRGPRLTYYRPSSLSHLMRLKALYPSAKLIVGNTEVGCGKNRSYIWYDELAK